MKYNLKAELHCHSLRRNRLFYCPLLYDSVQTEEEIINQCIEKDIRILCISDHDSLEGYKNAKKIIEDRNLDILLIPGSEISSKDGHILAYNISKIVPPKLTSKKTIKLIHDQGGMAIAAHPYMLLGVGNKIFTDEFDAVELFNSTLPNWANNKCNDKTKGIDIPLTVGSDAHQPNDVGRSYLLFPENTVTLEKFSRNLRDGNFKFKTERSPTAQMVYSHIFRNIKIQLEELTHKIAK